jgi:excisionase family DNA binding protein
MTTDQSTLQDAPATHQEQLPGTDQVEQGTGTYDLVTVKQAAERLGCSVQTVRRLIRSGRLRADLVARPQGSAWRVMLPVDQDVPVDHVVQTGTSLERPGAWHVPDIAAMLAPLVGELAEARQTIQRLADANGRLQTENEQIRAQLAFQAPREEPPAVELSITTPLADDLPDVTQPPHRPWWRYPWPYLSMAWIALLVAAGAINSCGGLAHHHGP